MTVTNRSNMLGVFCTLIAACSDGSGGTGGSGGSAGSGGSGGTGGTGGSGATTFLVRIENISGASALPTPLSPGAWAVHSQPGPFFAENMPDRGQGLEGIAEDGSPTMLATSLSQMSTLASSGAFTTPAGKTSPAPALPGDAYEFMVRATPDAPKLSLTTMFVQSNDLIIAPGESGIQLFDAQGRPLPQQDVTSQLALWDVGSEVNEVPGSGPNQAPRQPGPNVGAERQLHLPIGDNYIAPS